jgi:hypothetical protein
MADRTLEGYGGEETGSARDTNDEATAPESWAIVEIFGHRRYVGLVSETEQFGAKMCRIDVPGAAPGTIAATLLYGGAAIFSMRPITAERGRAMLAAEHNRRLPALLAPDPDSDRGELDDPEHDAL